MRKLLLLASLALAVLVVAVPVALAGSPHFVDDTVQATVSSSSVVVSGKEAGLGDETQVHIVATVEASCINGGGHNPKAANKDSFSASGDFPVQNGKAEFSLTVPITFQPQCSPPMTIQVTRVSVEDTEHGVSTTFVP